MCLGKYGTSIYVFDGIHFNITPSLFISTFGNGTLYFLHSSLIYSANLLSPVS